MRAKVLVVLAVVLLASLVTWLLANRGSVSARVETSGRRDSSSRAREHRESNRRTDRAELQTSSGEASEGALSAKAPIAGSNRAFKQLLDQWQVPIEFYGRVVDSDNNPVSGATIRFSWTENPVGGVSRTLSTESDALGAFALHGARGPSLDVQVSKEGYLTSKREPWSFVYGINGRFTPDAANPVLFHLKKRGNVEPLLRIGGTGMTTMSDYRTSSDGLPTEVSLHDGRKTAVGEGDLRMEIWIGTPLKNFPSRRQWRFRVTIPGGGLVPVTDEFAFLAPAEGYRESDECLIEESNWAENLEKRYYVRLRDGNYGIVTLHIIGARDPFFRLTSFLNPSGGRNLESAN